MTALRSARSRAWISPVLALALTVGCGDDDTSSSTDPDVTVPDTYSYASRFNSGESSVSYAGQTARLVLIEEIVQFLEGLTASIDDGSFVPAPGDVRASLEFFLDFDSDTSGDSPISISADPPLLQVTIDDVSSGKDLVGKIAGNDAVGQHKDFTTELAGWPGFTSAEGLVRAWFQEVDDIAVARAGGAVRLDPTGAPIGEVFLTSDGRDLNQLIEKFLLGAIAFSQGADDYLDDDTEGKGPALVERRARRGGRALQHPRARVGRGLRLLRSRPERLRLHRRGGRRKGRPRRLLQRPQRHRRRRSHRPHVGEVLQCLGQRGQAGLRQQSRRADRFQRPGLRRLPPGPGHHRRGRRLALGRPAGRPPRRAGRRRRGLGERDRGHGRPLRQRLAPGRAGRRDGGLLVRRSGQALVRAQGLRPVSPVQPALAPVGRRPRAAERADRDRTRPPRPAGHGRLPVEPA